MPPTYPRYEDGNMKPMDCDEVLEWLNTASLEDLRWFYWVWCS